MDDELNRMKTVGFFSQARLLLVVKNAEEVRIISARRADTNEEKEFEKRIRF
ncbi:MAG: hypothetical protein C5B49_07250 [Bdellovibrio sp.]|nr:MAG: hypothetical protein C5B49_07250 [Bdellovibrio sp.]